MTRIALLVAFLSVVGCRTAADGDALSLSFSSYRSTPVVLTHFAIEQPLAPTQKIIPGNSADIGPPRSGSFSVLNVPIDAGRDRKWRVSARWVELPTDRAWEAQVDVPIDDLTIEYRQYAVNVIMGPNGLLLIGSDKAGIKPSDLVDVVRTCGKRVPSDDKAWRRETGYFPQLPFVMGKPLPPVRNPECPNPLE